MGRKPAAGERRRPLANRDLERDLAKIMGKCKATCWGLRTWTPRPSLEKMLRVRPAPARAKTELQDVSVPRKGEQDRGGEAAEGSQTKGSFRAALEIARNKDLMAQAVSELKKDFWADSNRQAQASKRKLVIELAQAVGGEWWTPPLTESVVVGVAAALKAAGLKTAASLLNELKLWHVDQGHSVTDSLERLLSLAKKSVARNLGPVKRALEVKIAEIDRGVWQCSRHMEVCEPILAYAWAVIFMLRCAEVAAVRWTHVFADKSKKLITLRIPISKTDQAGWGVRRTLGCCGWRKCSWACAWKVWSEILERSTSKSEFVFVEDYEGAKSTRKVALAWKSKVNSNMSGHSARRSGAMMYVRAGLPLQEVAFLGRWKSNVVLSYAEEALEEVPANQRIVPGPKAAKTKEFQCWKAPRTPGTPQPDFGCDTPVPMTPQAVIWGATTPRDVEEGAKPVPLDGGISLLDSCSPKELWVYSVRDNRRDPTLHLVTVAGWDMPMSGWKTACGWPFAVNRAEAAFVYKADITKKKCRKCLNNRKGRDMVNEVELWRLKQKEVSDVLSRL